MFVTKKHLSRRTLLRGAGVSLALPVLESMVPAFRARAAVTPAVPRFVGIFNPHGWAPDFWQFAPGAILVAYCNTLRDSRPA